MTCGKRSKLLVTCYALITMITSTLIQAAEAAYKELQTAFSPEELPEMLADTGIGPHAFEHLVTSYAEQYAGDVRAAVHQAFIIGIYTERYNSNLEFGVMDPDDVLEIAGDEPAYENAEIQDVQDVLSCVFGVTTADDIAPDELGSLMMNTLMGAYITDPIDSGTSADPAEEARDIDQQPKTATE